MILDADFHGPPRARGHHAAGGGQAHLKDLAIQDHYGVKFLTYWFDEARGTTFCLVQAPDKETAKRVHREAHGNVANAMVEVELAVVEAFLGRVRDPEPPRRTGAGRMDPGLRPSCSPTSSARPR